MDFSRIDGYAFEDFMANFFRDQGYKVEPTAYSNDGGVDLIISCDEPIKRSKYFVQCKNWQAPVGVREVRELYGIVVADNINKGILITTGKYTPQAIEFSNGKSNIELIDGKDLAKLTKNYDSKSIGINNEYAFMEFDRFDKEKYLYFDSMIAEDKTAALGRKFRILWQFVENNDFEILKAGLIKELRNVIYEWQKARFKTKRQKENGGFLFYPYIIYLDVLEGKIDKAIENDCKMNVHNREATYEDCYESYYFNVEERIDDFFYSGIKLILNEVGKYINSDALQKVYGDEKEYEKAVKWRNKVFFEHREYFNDSSKRECLIHDKEGLIYIPHDLKRISKLYNGIRCFSNVFTFLSDIEANMWVENKTVIKEKAEKMLAMYLN